MRGPDGKERLVTRLLDQANASSLAGTEDGVDAFFSPDGQWIGFFADGKMKKVSVQGGSPVTICDAPSPHGASWGDDGNIVAALVATAGLARVSSVGGQPQALTRTGDKGELNHYWPQILPTGGAVLFTASTSGVAFEDASIDVFSTKTGEKKTLLSGGYFGRYIPTAASSGNLVYVHEGTLFGVPFDPVQLELKGTAAPLLEDVAGNPRTGAGRFDYSGLGTLIYESGKVASPSWAMAWLDGSGKTQPVPGLAPGFYTTPRISPDGERLTFRNGVGGSGAAKGDIFVYDLRRETLQRLTFTNQENYYPIWARDENTSRFDLPPPPVAPTFNGFVRTARASPRSSWKQSPLPTRTRSPLTAGGWPFGNRLSGTALTSGPYRSILLILNILSLERRRHSYKRNQTRLTEPFLRMDDGSPTKPTTQESMRSMSGRSPDQEVNGKFRLGAANWRSGRATVENCSSRLWTTTSWWSTTLPAAARSRLSASRAFGPTHKSVELLVAAFRTTIWPRMARASWCFSEEKYQRRTVKRFTSHSC